MAAHTTTVELYYGGQWHTAVVYERDPIVIKRGYAGESRQTVAATATFTLDDREGDYNPGNPMSALYGLAGRNTPVRITVDGELRFYGEAASWKPRRAVKGDAWTEVEAAGILRRLGQGSDPLLPALRYAIGATSPIAYWPLEDGASATQAASGLVGGAPMVVSGAVVFGKTSDKPAGAAAYADTTAADAKLVGPVPTATASATEWRFEMAVNFGVIAMPNTVSAAILRLENPSAANGFGWDIYGSHVDDGGLQIQPLVGTGSFAASNTVVGDGEWHWLSIRGSSAGGGANTRIVAKVDDVEVIDHTFVGYAFSKVAADELGNAGALVAHSALWAPWPASSTVDTYAAFTGYAGETAADRVDRLCDQKGVTATIVGTAALSEAMGAQPAGTLADLLAECARTDGGTLYEPRGSLGVAYRTRHDLYNQAAALALDFDGEQIAPPIDPDIDDKNVRNEVTAKRRDGSSARREKDTGPLSTQDPPDGVGRYDTQVDVNTETDDVLAQHANWRVHLGTCPDTRWPRITVDLDAAPDLATAASAVDVGDAITVDHLDPGQAQLMVLGYTETIGTHRRKITYNCAPWAPWEVWQLNTAGSTLTKAAAAAATTLKLDTSAGPEWSTSAEPYHIQIDGEAMTVTAMATDTITYVGAGAATHGVDGASVAPNPHASTAEGDLMVLFAAIRDTAATVADLTGWTELAVLANVRVFARYYRDGTGADDPTVTFTGGGAGDDTTAQIATFRGASLRLDDGAYLSPSPSPQTQANASAQDIAYPALSVRRAGGVVLYLGWKADDWTSVTSPGDAEIGEPDTTTGDDQGLVWSYDIQTTPTNVAAGSFTVTGGAAAVSKGITLALRPTQTATVTRAVNDVSKALTVGEAATGWRLGVLAL